MRRWIVFILLTGILLALVGAACTDMQPPEPTDTTSFDTFQTELNEGASCGRLYEIRNEIDPKDPSISLMNDELRRIECLSSSDVRTDGDRPPGTEGLAPINYNTSYILCSSDPEDIYQESGTDDPEEAARWLADGSSKPGVTYESSYQGCLDGLLGAPNKFDQ